jgi:restriction system protein
VAPGDAYADSQISELSRDVSELRQQLRRLENKYGELASQHEALKAGWRDAEKKTATAELDIMAIDEILSNALSARPPAFDELRDSWRPPAIDPEDPAAAKPEPRWEDYAPKPPRGIGLPGMAGRHERKTADARARYEKAVSQHAEEQRALWERWAVAVARNSVVEAMRTSFAAGAPEAIEWFVREALERSTYPDWYPREDRQYRVAYRPDSSEVFVELALPPAAVIPAVRRYYYDANRAACRELPRPRAEIRRRYAGLIASVALRTASEVFAATAEHPGAVRAVSLNGRARGTDVAPGTESRPHLVSMSVQRDPFGDLALALVEPRACLANLDARLSPDPLAPTAIQPLAPFPPPDPTPE